MEKRTGLKDYVLEMLTNHCNCMSQLKNKFNGDILQRLYGIVFRTLGNLSAFARNIFLFSEGLAEKPSNSVLPSK